MLLTLNLMICFAFISQMMVRSSTLPSSNRIIPIHKELIKSGFLEYVAWSKELKQKPFFDLEPVGDDLDRSKDYSDVLGDILDACGFKAGDRVISYLLRYTFIDEFKRYGVAEHVVAHIVGQKHQNLTYEHYGKLFAAEELVSSINAFKLHI